MVTLVGPPGLVVKPNNCSKGLCCPILKNLLVSYHTAFGLATLVFIGLEIAMHATSEVKCVDNVVIAHPILQALFTFLQMHFLFVNSQVKI